jgi:hypothetical protein
MRGKLTNVNDDHEIPCCAGGRKATDEHRFGMGIFTGGSGGSRGRQELRKLKFFTEGNEEDVYTN